MECSAKTLYGITHVVFYCIYQSAVTGSDQSCRDARSLLDEKHCGAHGTTMHESTVFAKVHLPLTGDSCTGQTPYTAMSADLIAALCIDYLGMTPGITYCWMTTITTKTNVRTTLCLNVRASTAPSLPLRFVTEMPVAMFWGEIILPRTPPDALVAANNKGLRCS